MQSLAAGWVPGRFRGAAAVSSPPNYLKTGELEFASPCPVKCYN
jgi:hypothetical protein